MMNKYQEALEQLSTQTDREIIYQDEINGWVDTLQELINKATPKPTVMTNNGFVCPTCGDDIKVKLLYAHYCNECGQRLE